MGSEEVVALRGTFLDLFKSISGCARLADFSSYVCPWGDCEGKSRCGLLYELVCSTPIKATVECLSSVYDLLVWHLRARKKGFELYSSGCFKVLTNQSDGAMFRKVN